MWVCVTIEYSTHKWDETNKRPVNLRLLASGIRTLISQGGAWFHSVVESHIFPIASGYLLHSHGKSTFLIGKPSISMGHLYHGYVSHNQRVFDSSWDNPPFWDPQTEHPCLRCNTHSYLWHNAEFDTIGSYLAKCTQYNHWFTSNFRTIGYIWVRFWVQIEHSFPMIPFSNRKAPWPHSFHCMVKSPWPHGWPHGPGQQPDLSSGCGCDFCSGSWIYIYI